MEGLGITKILLEALKAAALLKSLVMKIEHRNDDHSRGFAEGCTWMLQRAKTMVDELDIEQSEVIEELQTISQN